MNQINKRIKKEKYLAKRQNIRVRLHEKALEEIRQAEYTKQKEITEVLKSQLCNDIRTRAEIKSELAQEVKRLVADEIKDWEHPIYTKEDILEALTQFVSDLDTTDEPH